MVYELSAQIYFDKNATVLDAQSKTVTALDYASAFVLAKKPSVYITGNMITKSATENCLNFSLRFASTTKRKEISDFIATVKAYATAGIIKKHNCYHDEGKPCEAETVIDQWGVIENGIA